MTKSQPVRTYVCTFIYSPFIPYFSLMYNWHEFYVADVVGGGRGVSAQRSVGVSMACIGKYTNIEEKRKTERRGAEKG